jgi:hypothetical protein
MTSKKIRSAQNARLLTAGNPLGDQRDSKLVLAFKASFEPSVHVG